jgi:hypothetical protein
VNSASGVHVADADGLSLTVTLDRSAVAPGEVVTFTATLHNGRAAPVNYSVPWCGGGASAAVSVDLPQEPSGRSWSGIAQTFKDFVLTQGLGPGGVAALSPQRLDVAAEPCRDGQFEAILAPGESVVSSMPWKAEIVAGVGAHAGSVPLTVSVGYDRQNSPPSYPPDYQGPRGLWVPMYKQLVVSGALNVVGDARPLAGPGEVIDSVLANKKFAKWLAAQPRATWSGANLFLTTSKEGEGFVPKGPSWELDLFREIGVPRHWAIAFIDPFDASLLSINYCDVPCDR